MDSELRLQQHVQQAIAAKQSLHIVGGNSKAFYGDPVQADQVIATHEHSGVITYEPSELVLTAKAGTPLTEIEAVLAEAKQQLPFEPPNFTGSATLGGVIAAGLSGPRRMFAGAVRDAVLGVKIINGKGEILTFGGQVMKNVAGFDVSRLMAGSLGTLGLILQVSVKTRPVPEQEFTLALSLPASQALSYLSSVIRLPFELSASAWFADVLYLRIIGSEPTLAEAQKQFAGAALISEHDFWTQIKNHWHRFFADGRPLWRVCVPSTAALPAFEHEMLMEWQGCLRWIRSDEPAQAIRAYAAENHGHACRFMQGTAQLDCFQSLTPVQASIHQKIKYAFDPRGLFNPGRMASLFSSNNRESPR